MNKEYSNISTRDAITDIIKEAGVQLRIVDNRREAEYIQHQKKVIDRLSRRIQKLKLDKKRLLERLDEISFVFIDKISTPHYQEEEWCFWYQCPKCHHYSIAEGYKFCPQCASKVRYINDHATHEEKKNSQCRYVE